MKVSFFGMHGSGTHPAFEVRRAALLIPDTGTCMHTLLIRQTQAQPSEAGFDAGSFSTLACFCEGGRILTALRKARPALICRSDRFA